MEQEIINWEDKIKWLDKTSHKAEDTYENYISFMKYFPELKDKFCRKGVRAYFDGKLYNSKEDFKWIKQLIKVYTNLSNSTVLQLAVTSTIQTSPVFEPESEDDEIKIAPQFKESWKTINDNLEDKDLINSIISTIKINPKSINEKDWDEYKEWRKNEALVHKNSDGEITGYIDCYQNLIGWLNHYPIFKNKITYNEITQKVQFDDKPVTESLLHFVTQAICKHFIPNFSNLNSMYNAIIGAGCQNHINPIQDYFSTLKYDGSRNWIRWFITDVLKCEDEKYFDLYEFELTRFMVAFIKRNVKENYFKDIKFDNILVLSSEVGGSGKSSVFKKLFEFNEIGYCQEMSANVANSRNTDLLMNMHMSACVNFDEISMSRKLVNDFKTFLQSTKDNYRVPYGHVNEDRIRHFVFAATSNNNDFLKDYTSITERRWWIIHISEDKTNGIAINKLFNDKELNLKDKLWGQAMKLYRDNPDMELWLSDVKLQEDLDNLQQNYKATNNSDYNEIVNILNSQWGFYDDEDVSVDAIVEQYNHTGGAMDWCKLHNEQITKLRNKEGYVMTPNDKLITHFGHIDKISSSKLHNILKKLNLNFTIPSLKNVLTEWDANKAARISGKVTCCYVRKEKFDDKYKLEIDNYGNINETTYDNTGLPF